MENKARLVELMSSLEHIVLAREVVKLAPVEKAEPAAIPEPQRLREITGMQVDEFARVMGVSISSVKSWEAKRTRPSGTAQKLMKLLHSNPTLGRQLLD